MDILKKLLTQAEQVEVLDVVSEATTVNFESNSLKGSKVEETRGTAVRVMRDGKLGFAASTLSGADDKLVQNALESASYGDKLPIKFPQAQPAAKVNTYDEKIVNLPVSKLVEMGREIIDILLKASPEAKVNVALNRGVQKASIRNQTGLDVSFERSPLSVSIEVADVKGDDVLLVFDIIGSTIWEEEYLAATRRLGEKLILAQKITDLQPGEMPVLFSPTGLLGLMLPLDAGLNGKNVFMGASPIREKVGEKLFDDKITVIDDGTLDGRFGSAAYDDEGVPHRRNVLVEKGVLKGFYYDLKTAAMMGVESTGNGARSLFSPPGPSTTNVILQSGEKSLKDIINGIDHGLLVEDLLGIGQGNIISGAFSNPLSLAFLIEKGEIVGRVKNASIAGNIYDLLKNVAAVSSESFWVYQGFLAPYMLLPNMNIVTG
jgi:PmbA protein